MSTTFASLGKAAWLALLLVVFTTGVASAGGTTPVTSGSVIRGLTISGGAGTPGTATGTTCDFSGEDVGMDGKMTGASVNCQQGGNTQQVLIGLPTRFNAYCVTQAKTLGGRLIPAPVPGNNNHCDLSAISPKDATQKFGGAVWR